MLGRNYHRVAKFLFPTLCIMGLSKIVRRTENKISRVVPVVNKVVSGSGKVLNKAGNVLDKASDVSGKILNNPIVQGFVAANPELLPLYGGAVAASKLVGTAGKAADKGANVAGKVSNVLEKIPPKASSSLPQSKIAFA